MCHERTDANFSCFALAACFVAAPISAARAANLYWSGNGTTQGGNGTWDTTLTRWGTAPAGPYSTVWNNASFDTAFFGGTAGTATLGTNIDVGGLQFDTTGYRINNGANILSFGAANNAIVFNNIAAATITGNVSGSGNVTLSATNPATAGTLTLNGTTGNGWSGTTTVNAGMTLTLLSEASTVSSALANTSAVTINGGTIQLTRSAGGNAQNQLSNTANITFNGGGTLSLMNGIGGSFTETTGNVTVSSGQANFTHTNGSSGLGVLTTLSGLSRTGTTSAVTFSNANSAQTAFRVSGAADTAANEIIGPWATFGTAANAQTDYAIYTSGNGTVAARNIAGSAQDTWISSNNSYTTSAGGTVTLNGTRTMTALRNTGATTVLTLASGANLETYGLLNGAATLLTVAPGTGGVLTTPTGGGNLYLTTYGINTDTSGAHTGIIVTAPINNNGVDAVTLVKSGVGVLQLNATSNYSGGTVLNSGTLWAQTDASLGEVNGDITFDGSATLVLAPNNGTGGYSYSLPATRSIIVSNGAMATIAGGRANAAITINGDISGSGGVTTGRVALLSNGGIGSPYTFSLLGSNTFTGAFNVGTGAETSGGGGTSWGVTINSLADSTSPITLNFGQNGAFFSLGSGAPANLSVPNRPIDLRNSNTTIRNQSGTRTMTLGAVSTTTAGAQTLNLGDGGAGGFIAGNITNGAGTIAVTKSGNGSFSLSGTNSYTGATTISGGTLTLGNGTAAGSLLTSSAISVASGATFAINQSDTVTQGTDFSNAVITGAGNFSQAGSGTTILNLANTFSGTTTVSAGTLRLDVNTALQNSVLNVAGGAVTLNTGNSTQIFGGLSGSTNLAAGITSGYTGNVTSLILNTASTTAATYTGVIADGATGMTLTKNGTGTQSLGGNNTFTGGLVVNAGTLRLTGNQAFTGNVTLNGGTFGDSTDAISATELNNNSVTVTGAASMGVANASTFSSSAGIAINSAGNLTLGSTAGSATFDGVLSGNGTLTVSAAPGSGSGSTVTFRNLGNTFTGNVSYNSINNGGFALAVASFLDTASPGDGNIRFGGGSGVIATFNFTVSSNATAPVTLNNRQFDLTTANNGQVYQIENASSQAFNINSNLTPTGTGNKTLTLQGTGSGLSSFNGTIANGSLTTLGITKAGSGTWVLAGNNTYNGVTNVSAGTLRVSLLANGNATSNIGSSSNVASNLLFGNGATLTYVGSGGSTDRSFTINGTLAGHSAILDASGTGAINSTSSATPGYGTANQTRTLTLTGNNTDANTLAANLANNGTGAVSISKLNTGRWLLSGTNTYNGTTTINAGVLQSIDGTGVPTASILELRGGVFQSSGNFTRAVSTAAGAVNWSTSSGGFAAINGPLNLQLNNGTASVTWNGASMVSTGQTLIFGSSSADSLVDFQNALNLGSSDSGQRTIQVNDNASSLTDIARISGNVTNTAAGWGILKTGSGTLQLTGTNSYTGVTTVNAGVLETTTIANGNSTSGIGSSSNAAANLTFGAPDAVLRYTGSSNATTDRSFTLSSGVGGGATIESSGSGALSFNNTVALAYGTANQTRTLTLGGTNAGLNTFGKVIADNGTGATSLVKSGAGRWVLDRSNTYTGGTTVNAGTLLVNNSSGSGTGTGSLTIAALATLGGNGTIAGATTIFGAHTPGNSPGLQTFGSDLTYSGGNATIQWELTGNTTAGRGTNYDGIDVGGNLDFVGATSLSLVFNGANSTVDWNNTFWASNQSWLLHDVAGSTGNFTNLSIAASSYLDSLSATLASVRSGASFNVSQSGSDVLTTTSPSPNLPRWPCWVSASRSSACASPAAEPESTRALIYDLRAQARLGISRGTLVFACLLALRAHSSDCAKFCQNRSGSCQANLLCFCEVGGKALASDCELLFS